MTAARIRSAQSVWVCMLNPVSSSSGEPRPHKHCFSSGNISNELRSAVKSRAFAVPTSMRVRIRSISYTDFNDSRKALRTRGFSTISPTASCRRRISSRFNSGDSSHCRSNRPPIAVTVKSSTASKLPRFPPSRILRLISRLRKVVPSSSKKSCGLNRVNRLMWLRSDFKV